MKLHLLSAKKVETIKTQGYHLDGGGLYLQVSPQGTKSWIFMYKVRGTNKHREMGLGSVLDVSLAAAREKASECRRQLADGLDPITVRDGQRAAFRAQMKNFEDCASAYIKSKSSEWKNPKHKQQWANTLDQYAYPVIGKLMVRDISLGHVLRILEPIWTEKTETASRLRGRIEVVLDWATVHGYRTGDNPARWKGHLDKILAAPTKVAKVEHHEAIALDDAAQFMADLRAQAGMGALALQFLILTAARSGEVRGATWGEIDLDAAVWTVPADRMKAKKEHRVPLSTAAVKLLKTLPRSDKTDLVFFSPTHKALSDMTLSAVMRRMGVDAVPHGMRSTFKDWAFDRTKYPNELSEMALAHAIQSKVEEAYRRGDGFERRRRMMEDYSKFLSTSIKPGKVLPMKKRAA